MSNAPNKHKWWVAHTVTAVLYLFVAMALLGCQEAPDSASDLSETNESILLTPDSAKIKEQEGNVNQNAATGDIRGVVRTSGGEPIPRANVVIDSLRMGAASMPDGSFIMRGIPVGIHTISVVAGDERKKILVPVSADSLSQVDIVLE